MTSRARSAAAVYARTRSTTGANDGLPISSSSLIRSTPPSAVAWKISAPASGVRPVHGLIMFSSRGRSGTPTSRRTPAIPNRGPTRASARESGSSRSTSLACTDVELSLPSTVVSRFGSDGPKFTVGSAICTKYPLVAPVWVARSTGGASSTLTTRPRWRSRISAVTPGTSTQVPVVWPIA